MTIESFIWTDAWDRTENWNLPCESPLRVEPSLILRLPLLSTLTHFVSWTVELIVSTVLSSSRVPFTVRFPLKVISSSL